MKAQAEAELLYMLEIELADFLEQIRAENPRDALAKLRVYSELTAKMDTQSLYALTYRLLN